jgi:pyruvate ferredoxin oxidoreductase beta subunit
MEVGRMGVKTGLIPLFEMEDGAITKIHRIKKRLSVEDYLKAQGRYKHLFKSDHGKEEIDELQQLADRNIDKYGLMTSAK